MNYIAALVLLIVLALHQDSWNWTDKSLVFGYLPVGLAYHGGYTLVACATMALLVRGFWPRHLDTGDDPSPEADSPVPVAPTPLGSAPEANHP
jgi:hypothetical protein